jgi:HD-GYP domain-containing protein (c-di-GMP phosphodiesterase class II)
VDDENKLREVMVSALSVFAGVTRSFEGPRHKLAEEETPAYLHLWIAVSKAVDGLEGRAIRHGLRVARLAQVLAQQVNLSTSVQASLLQAGLLHDLGLVPVASRLLGALPLGVTVQDALKLHSLVGVQWPAGFKLPTWHRSRLPEPLPSLLADHGHWPEAWSKGLNLSKEACQWVSLMHERSDGSGSPRGLGAAGLPLAAHVLALADVVTCLMESNSAGLEQRLAMIAAWLKTPQAQTWFPQPLLDALAPLCEPTEAHPGGSLATLFSVELEKQLLLQAGWLAPHWLEPLEGVPLLQACQSIGAISEAIDLKSLHGSSQKVAKVAFTLAKAMEVPEHQTGELLLSALVCGLGRLNLPLETLRMSNGLHQKDRLKLAAWPCFNEQTFARVPGFNNVALWSSELLERMTGTGLPYEKRGQELSLGGRLLALACSYVAMLSDRPFRPYPYKADEALAIMQKGQQSRLYDSYLLEKLEACLPELSTRLQESQEEEEAQEPEQTQVALKPSLLLHLERLVS